MDETTDIELENNNRRDARPLVFYQQNPFLAGVVVTFVTALAKLYM